MITMRPPVLAGIIALAAALVVASFRGGQVAERRAQQQSNIRANQTAAALATKKQNRLLADDTAANDHVIIANVAAVSFGELWDVMRSASAEKRTSWARELEQMPSGTRRNAAVKSFFKISAELDPAATVQELAAIRDKRIQSLAFSAAADAAADSALPAFAELENRLGYRTNSFSPTSVLARWAAADPLAVARFLEAHPQTASGHFMEVTYNWANADPEKAGEWFTNLRLPPFDDPKYPRAEDRRRLEAARGLLLSWLEKDSLGAAVFAATHSSDPEIKQALGEFGESLFIRSHEEATTFIQSLPDEGAQRAALKEILGHLSARVITIREGGDDEEPAEPEIEPEEIPPWLVTLPAKIWIDHVGEIFRSWDASDSSRAEAWLRSLPLDAKSKAISDYCAAASIEQAPRIFQLLALVNETNVRNKLLQSFVDQLSDDPSEIREKISSLPLTKQQKQILLRRVRDDQ